MDAACWLPQDVPSAGVLDQAAADPREIRRRGRGARGVILHHGVVVDVRDGPALIGVETQIVEVADDEGLEVHHEVPPQCGVLQPRQEQEPRRLDGPAGHDDHLGLHGPLDPVGAHVVDPRGAAPLDAYPRDEGLGHQLGPAGRHGLGQEGHRVTLGVDRAAVEGAVAAVVAGGSAVVGDAVGRRGGLVGVEPDPFGGRGRQRGAVHRRARGHRVGP
jgi:hypothetical protein